ncbi:class I SAM-dependent methyltransferase [Rhabdothermincola sediminis]|uniref:class I SAM-dependent methyltransferase n=1 Tax=Rhabdothermincola sediminis TaxID=2751370 RepID=UPI001AA03171|nr:class I SAM-dependent methyltransferase [Rhabdothermincola sediminis]
MPDQPDDLTSTHPSGHLRPAPDPTEDLQPDAGGSRSPLSAVFPATVSLPDDVVSYGPDIATEAVFRLLGHLEGKRVLELGCGAGQAAVALAYQGAHVIAVDPSHRRLEQARNACERAEVRVELHQSDLAELAFVRADTIDVALSVYALASVTDLDRVFRQVHRVLRTGCPLVFSLPHPALRVAEGNSYFDRSPLAWDTGDATGQEQPRTISEVFTSLTRANFRVDALLEPEPLDGPRSALWKPAMERAPATLLVRGRKEGI